MNFLMSNHCMINNVIEREVSKIELPVIQKGLMNFLTSHHCIINNVIEREVSKIGPQSVTLLTVGFLE